MHIALTKIKISQTVMINYTNQAQLFKCFSVITKAFNEMCDQQNNPGNTENANIVHLQI